jgi:phospholipase/carboxylesterase
MTRRDFLAYSALAVSRTCVPAAPAGTDARLRARPAQPASQLPPGRHPLGLGTTRDGVLYVPTKYRPDTPAPVALMLHGAGNSAAGVAFAYRIADEFGTIVVAPDSRDRTWDAVQSGFGPDVTFIDAALGYTFAHCAADPRRLSVGGFSDGASYALSLGLANGDLFTHVLAFSPGFISSAPPHGRPRLFISHGTRDRILPIASTSRVIVPQLEAAGYTVRYREFDGPHTVPDAVAREAFTWFTS